VYEIEKILNLFWKKIKTPKEIIEEKVRKSGYLINIPSIATEFIDILVAIIL